ncbi:MAG: hypothetical protein ACI37Q_01155 [Candidatus Gastranaerophilaceae bacterium]
MKKVLSALFVLVFCVSEALAGTVEVKYNNAGSRSTIQYGANAPRSATEFGQPQAPGIYVPIEKLSELNSKKTSDRKSRRCKNCANANKTETVAPVNPPMPRYRRYNISNTGITNNTASSDEIKQEQPQAKDNAPANEANDTLSTDEEVSTSNENNKAPKKYTRRGVTYYN